MTNRNPVKQLFITFPKSNIDKHSFRDVLLRFEPDYYMIVQETHEDGSPHLHAIVRFKNKFSKPFVVKYFKDTFPNDYKRIDVKPVRSIKQSIKYLSKEDKDPLVSGEFISNRDPQSNWLDKFARELGYNSRTHLVEQSKIEEDFLEELRTLIHPMWLEWMNQLSFNSECNYKIKKLHNDLFSKNIISKDDMTFLIKIYNLRLNLP